MAVFLSKAITIWLLILIMAIANAAIRETILTPTIGFKLALPVSGLLLSIIIFLIALGTIPWVGSTEGKTYILIGILWVVLTLAFEFLFGHFVAGKTWSEIAQVFDVRKGDLFVVALLSTLLSPWLSAKARGLI